MLVSYLVVGTLITRQLLFVTLTAAVVLAAFATGSQWLKSQQEIRPAIESSAKTMPSPSLVSIRMSGRRKCKSGHYSTPHLHITVASEHLFARMENRFLIDPPSSAEIPNRKGVAHSFWPIL